MDAALARLATILEENTEASHNLDPVTVLRWFTALFTPDGIINPADYALRIWPDPLAKDAIAISVPLLETCEYKTADALRLKISIALGQAQDCRLDEAAPEGLLDKIVEESHAVSRVIGFADDLTYLDSYDAALPVFAG